MDKVLTERQRMTLRLALDGRFVVLCFSAGLDSTGLMVAMWAAGLRPDLVSMADVGDEKPGTWQDVERMGEVLQAYGVAIGSCFSPQFKTTEKYYKDMTNLP